MVSFVEQAAAIATSMTFVRVAERRDRLKLLWADKVGMNLFYRRILTRDREIQYSRCG